MSLNALLPRPAISPSGVSVLPVTDDRTREAFLRFPRLLHPDARWGTRSHEEQAALLDPEQNPFLQHGRVQLYVAERDGAVVGRVAAVDDPLLNAAQGTRHGCFGLFDCVDDPSVARELLDAVRDWHRARGRRTLLGPMNFSTNQECGMLIDAFALPPALMMPHNPPYYPALMERCGLRKAKDLFAWEYAPAAPRSPRVERLCAALERRGTVAFRSISPEELIRRAYAVRVLYNRIWQDNWGFAPATATEFRHLVRQIQPLLANGAAVLAESGGAPVGFMLLLPNAGTTTGRVMAMGVLPEVRAQGAGVLLVRECFERARALGMTSFEGSWTLEDDDAVNRIGAAFGGVRTKTYRIYTASL
jgi:GNAT superfamily N-acetyltransferase